MESGRKFSVELKQTAKREWYISAVNVMADNKEELSIALDEALNIAEKKLQQLDKPRVKFERAGVEIELTDEEQDVFNEMRKLRMELANKEGIPPYMMLHDSALKEIIRKKPMTKEDMLKIHGISEVKFEKYGKIFLDFLLRQRYSED